MSPITLASGFQLIESKLGISQEKEKLEVYEFLEISELLQLFAVRQLALANTTWTISESLNWWVAENLQIRDDEVAL